MSQEKLIAEFFFLLGGQELALDLKRQQFAATVPEGEDPIYYAENLLDKGREGRINHFHLMYFLE